MEENLNQQKSQVLGPSAPEITIRTMESDIKAIEQGGGEMVAPQPFVLEQTKIEEPPAEVKWNIPGYTGPEKPTFTPTGSLRQGFSEASAISAKELSEKKTNKWKIIGIIIGILIGLVGLGLLGYFVVSQWIFPTEMPPVQ